MRSLRYSVPELNVPVRRALAAFSPAFRPPEASDPDDDRFRFDIFEYFFTGLVSGRRTDDVVCIHFNGVTEVAIT